MSSSLSIQVFDMLCVTDADGICVAGQALYNNLHIV
jgi:hypothetical protein